MLTPTQKKKYKSKAMDLSVIIDQLLLCVTSLKDIFQAEQDHARSQLDKKRKRSASSNDDITQLASSKSSLLGAVIALNELFWTLYCDCVNASSLMFAGRVCLANRWTTGESDLVLLIEREDPQDCDDPRWNTCWLRPRNVYECRSCSVVFHESELRALTNRRELDAQRIALNNTAVGQRVICKCPDSQWRYGTVETFTAANEPSAHDIVTIHVHIGMDTETVICSASDALSVCTASAVAIPTDAASSADATHVRAPDSVIESREECVHYGVRRDPFGDGDADRDAYDRGADASKGISEFVANGYVLGAWERNTKGIGSKLLNQMGFVRCAHHHDDIPVYHFSFLHHALCHSY